MNIWMCENMWLWKIITLFSIAIAKAGEMENEIEISGDLKQLIKRITPGFEENLVRAFKNEGLRYQQSTNNNRNINKLDSVFISVDDTKIELANLKFPWTPDFRIIKLSADLSMLCLDVAFKLGDLRTEGDYEATNMTLQRLLPITSNGRIETTFRDVVIRGKVGLLIEGDSFVPENYDIEYESTETSISVRCSFFLNIQNAFNCHMCIAYFMNKTSLKVAPQ
ncbi:unnamed protein product, partial [Callosobruchus maculatus]